MQTPDSIKNNFNPLIPSSLIATFTVIGLMIILLLHIYTFDSPSITIALFGGLLTTTLFLFKPFYGFLSIITIRLFADKIAQSISISYENINVNALALLGALFVFLSIIYLAIRKVNILKIPLVYIFAIFLSVSFISIFFSIDKITSFYEIIRMASIACAYFLAYDFFSKDHSRFNLFIKYLLYASIIPFIFAFYQIISESGFTGDTTAMDSRLNGTFGHPNEFAFFTVIIIGLCIYLILQKREEKNSNDKINLWILYIFTAISFFFLIETFSRGAILMILCFAGVLSLFKSPKILIGLIAGLIVAYFFIPAVHDRVQETIDPPLNSSIYWRYEQWYKGLKSFSKKPIYGYGIGTEIQVYEANYGYYSQNMYTHNDYLKFAIELGVIGFLSYVAFLGITILQVLRKYLKEIDQKKKIYFLIILALVIGVGAYSFLGNIFRQTGTQWCLWSLIAAVFSLNAFSNKTENRPA